MSAQPRPDPPTLRSQLYRLSDLLAGPVIDLTIIRQQAQDALALYQQERRDHPTLSLLLRNLLADVGRKGHAVDRAYYARLLTTAVDRL